MKRPLASKRRLAAHADVAPRAVGQVAPHQHVAERRARLEQRAVRVPAALDLDAGFPAPLADDAPGERLLGRASLRTSTRVNFSSASCSQYQSEVNPRKGEGAQATARGALRRTFFAGERFAPAAMAASLPPANLLDVYPCVQP